MVATSRIQPLDGLRFLAFLFIFVHHSPVPPPRLSAWSDVSIKLWSGVDLFFALSGFLLFTKMGEEKQRTGRVDLFGFFARRIARIYPLMIVFAALALVANSLIAGQMDDRQWLRVIGLALGIDNIIPLIGLGNIQIPHTLHFWSLSYELQFYMMVPALFVFAQRVSGKVFLYAVAAAFLYSALARFVAYGLGAQHPTIYFLPFFRPESLLIGVALWAIKPVWDWRLSGLASAVGWTAFFALPQPWESGVANIFAYPALAIGCGGLIDCVMRGPTLAKSFSTKWATYLGERAYGLYVFHFPAIPVAKVCIAMLGFRVGWRTHVIGAFTISVLAAVLSYRYFERPIQRAVSNYLRER